MKLVHFTEEPDREFIVLCDDEFLAETIEEHAPAKVSYVGSLDRDRGSESMLPTDRELRAT